MLSHQEYQGYHSANEYDFDNKYSIISLALCLCKAALRYGFVGRRLCVCAVSAKLYQ